MKERTRLALKFEAVLISICLVLLMLWLLTSCTTTKYIPVEHHTTDTVYQSKLQRDSVWLHDSIHVTEKGDTVRIEKWHTKYISKEVHDTLYKSRTDSIPVPYEVVKEVPAKLSTGQKGLMLVGIASLMALLIFIVYKLKRFLP